MPCYCFVIQQCILVSIELSIVCIIQSLYEAGDIHADPDAMHHLLLIFDILFSTIWKSIFGSDPEHKVRSIKRQAFIKFTVDNAKCQIPKGIWKSLRPKLHQLYLPL